MLHNVSLNASMRANLLSLQQTSKLQDITSNRLSTGLKVNSAIDNPSAYYTAQSLSDRASDLNALLDAMSQGIQTLKAVAETIDAASGFLQQAKAVASQALETISVPSKEWFIENTDAVAVVSSAQELLDTINAETKGNILIYGEINLNSELTLKDGQNLVGVGFFGNFDSISDKFSKLSFELPTTSQNTALILSQNNKLSDLSLSMRDNSSESIVIGVESNKTTVLRNLDISFDVKSGYGIKGGLLEIQGSININALNGKQSSGIYLSQISAGTNSTININNCLYGIRNCHTTLNDNAIVNISSSSFALGFEEVTLNDKSCLNIILSKTAIGSMKVNLNSSQSKINISADALTNGSNNSYFNITKGAQINLAQKGSYTCASDLNNYHIPNNSYPPENIFILDSSLQASIIQNLNYVFANFMKNEKSDPQMYLQYNSLLKEYDSLIKDGAYKNLNLLYGDNLKINFNENKTSGVNIKGIQASSQALGIRAAKWDNLGTVAQSLAEISSALNQIRDFAVRFGTYNNILSTRQEFTEAMINVLEEGADKLTLADMNQESANMLTLQTRQMLAVNALSLASKNSRSVLTLF